ncbi:MAG TPA: hypothetical protein VI894_01105 [Candidatus Nanoarchaeia archaeon]|nr:hypothetical protein [Candidatus Nanoarchaeia archaeon]
MALKKLKRNKRNKKAQAVALDLIAAVSIAMTVVIIVLLLYNNYTLRLDKKVDYLRMNNKAHQISEVLVMTQGRPASWNENFSTIENIGLALTDRNLSQVKIDAFINLSNTNYSRMLDLLGTEGYNFTLAINSLNGSQINTTDVKPTTTSTVVNLQRRVLVGTSIRTLDFKVWK